ncbi:MAG: hypothetical protein AAF921_15595 [Cyanobacteria bacterium P01_D01_bin.44]
MAKRVVLAFRFRRPPTEVEAERDEDMDEPDLLRGPFEDDDSPLDGKMGSPTWD